MKKIKDLKQGEFFTLKEIAEPKETQVFIRRFYDKSEKAYWCEKASDFCAGRYLKGDRLVYDDQHFIF